MFINLFLLTSTKYSNFRGTQGGTRGSTFRNHYYNG